MLPLGTEYNHYAGSVVNLGGAGGEEPIHLAPPYYNHS